jgi:hypothetical protein
LLWRVRIRRRVCRADTGAIVCDGCPSVPCIRHGTESIRSTELCNERSLISAPKHHAGLTKDLQKTSDNTSVQLQSTNAQIPSKTRGYQKPESKTSQQLTEPGDICKTSIPVQIRAAPPIQILENLAVVLLGSAALRVASALSGVRTVTRGIGLTASCICQSWRRASILSGDGLAGLYRSTVRTRWFASDR